MPRNVDDNAPVSRAPFKDLQSSVINKDNIQKPFFVVNKEMLCFKDDVVFSDRETEKEEEEEEEDEESVVFLTHTVITQLKATALT